MSNVHPKTKAGCRLWLKLAGQHYLKTLGQLKLTSPQLGTPPQNCSCIKILHHV